MVERLAKYTVYSVYRFIGCIIDQSNWSGPFSLLVMTPDFHHGDRGSRPGLAGCLFTCQYFSSYYIWCLVPVKKCLGILVVSCGYVNP